MGSEESGIDTIELETQLLPMCYDILHRLGKIDIGIIFIPIGMSNTDACTPNAANAGITTVREDFE
jgi:hypothetical protein